MFNMYDNRKYNLEEEDVDLVLVFVNTVGLY